MVLTEMDKTERVTEALEKCMREVHSIELNGRDKDTDGEGFLISFSAGAARYPLDAGNLPDLKKCADKALYESKEKGRNGYTWFAN